MIDIKDNERREAEQAVIGSMIKRISAASCRWRQLSPGADFAVKVHQIIFDAAVDKAERGMAFDPIVAHDIVQTKLGDEAAKYILELIEITPTAANVMAYAKIVKRHSGLRFLRDNIQTMLSEDDPTVIAGDIAGLCQEFLRGNTTNRVSSLKDALLSMYDEKRSKNPILRIDTGMRQLDFILKGLCGGNLIVIAARTGVGKSAFSMQLAKHAAAKGNLTLIVSMEMLKEEVAERCVAMDPKLSLDKLIDGGMNAQEWSELATASTNISTLPIMICDDPRTSVAKIRAMARSMPDLKLIVVDYLTLMDSGRKMEKRYQEIGAITRDLKILAAELKIPIVALSQLNREKDETDEPTLRELRESGDIEQDANKVIMLWKTLKVENNTPQPIGCKVAKNRRGRTGIVNLIFDGDHMRFAEAVDIPEPPKKVKKPFE